MVCDTEMKVVTSAIYSNFSSHILENDEDPLVGRWCEDPHVVEQELGYVLGPKARRCWIRFRRLDGMKC